MALDRAEEPLRTEVLVRPSKPISKMIVDNEDLASVVSRADAATGRLYDLLHRDIRVVFGIAFLARAHDLGAHVGKRNLADDLIFTL